MLLGLTLLWVGAVLFINGIWLLGSIDDREVVVINVVSGLVALAVAWHGAFGAGANPATVRDAALTLMFSTTYLWVAHNRLAEVDGRGLGWFSLFVAVTTVPVALGGFAAAESARDLWMAANWAAWGVLWLLYFLLLAAKKPILRATGIVTLLTGILTGWLPGFLILDGWI
jgi:putative amide transporter protein